MQKPSDELLVAYLDGELDDAQRAEVAAALEHDAATRESLAQLSESAAVIRAAFDEILREDVPERLLAAAHGAGEAGEARVAEVVPFRGKRGRPGWPSWAAYRRWWVAVPVAASIVGLMLGGGLGYFSADKSGPDEKQVSAVSTATTNWLDNVAEYHKLFVLATAGEGSFTDVPAKDGEAGSEVLQKLSQRTGDQQSVKAPNLKPWGLVLQGARVVLIESRPATQYVYTADNETVGKAIGPLTVVIGSTKRPDVAPTFDHRQDVNLLYWRRKGHAYAIVGQADIGYMWGLANDIAWQLDPI
jgi:anti-sigma factor RsiW